MANYFDIATPDRNLQCDVKCDGRKPTAAASESPSSRACAALNSQSRFAAGSPMETRIRLQIGRATDLEDTQLVCKQDPYVRTPGAVLHAAGSLRCY
jgi:hypothetical protein